MCSYLHRLQICQSKYWSAPCNSTTPPEFLLYLWDGCVDCKLKLWCLVLDYIVLKFILCVFGWNLKAMTLLDLEECKEISQGNYIMVMIYPHYISLTCTHVWRTHIFSCFQNIPLKTPFQIYTLSVLVGSYWTWILFLTFPCY